MADNLDPVIDFCAWEVVGAIGNASRGEHIITTFVSNIDKIETYRLSDDSDETRVYTVSIDGAKYFITAKTYNLIKERMYKGTPIKIEEVICVERV